MQNKKLSALFNTGDNPLSEFTEVQPSPISGLGLFAKVDIPAGTIWWNARHEDVLIIDKNQFEVMTCSAESPLMQNMIECILTYSYYARDIDGLVFCLDDARYCNHSSTPNSGGDDPTMPQFASMAITDISAGEEILEDYTRYDQCPWAKTCEKFLF